MRPSATKKLAIGILAAAGIAMSVPASAQGVWVGAGPVGVGVGVGPVYDGYAYVGERHCRIVREDFNGRLRTIRRCW
jgi:hypothetical protein